MIAAENYEHLLDHMNYQHAAIVGGVAIVAIILAVFLAGKMMKKLVVLIVVLALLAVVADWFYNKYHS